MIWFVLQTVVVIAGLYALPALGNLREQVGQIGVAATAAVISAALFFLWDFIRAPALIDGERRAIIKEQGESLAAFTEQAAPRLVIDRKLVSKPNNSIQYLVVRNQSSTTAINNCSVYIDRMTHEAGGTEVFSHAPLKTEAQMGDKSDGRFDLRAGQSARLPFIGGGSGPSNFRVVLAAHSPKFPNGNYKIELSAYAETGGPTKATVLIRGDRAVVHVKDS